MPNLFTTASTFAGILIAWGIGRNLRNDTSDEIANGDAFAAAFGDWISIPPEAKHATGNSVAGGSGSQERQRASVLSHSGAPIYSRSLRISF